MIPTIVNEYNPSKNKILYHYCSADTFYKIVSSKTLWLCDIRHMNDSMELLYGEHVFKDSLRHSTLSEDLQKEIMDLYRQFYSSLVVLSISFSESGEILSQWRGYSDDAKGFCIGFDACKLVSKLPFCPLKVIYSEKEQKRLMSRIIKTIHSNLNSDRNTILYLISELIEVFAQVKHPSFCEEKELRLTHALIVEDNESLSDEVKNKGTAYEYGIHDVSFRLANNIPTPYVSVDFPKTDNFVKEIIIGSKNRSEITDVQLFLNTIGLNNVYVRKYNSSYNV